MHLAYLVFPYALIGYLLAEGAFKAMNKLGASYRGPAYALTLLAWPLLFIINMAIWLFAPKKVKVV